VVRRGRSAQSGDAAAQGGASSAPAQARGAAVSATLARMRWDCLSCGTVAVPGAWPWPKDQIWADAQPLVDRTATSFSRSASSCIAEPVAPAGTAAVTKRIDETPRYRA